MAELRLVIVIPVFNDWVAFARLIRDIDATLHDGIRDLRIVAVDDGSTEAIPDDLAGGLELQRVRSLSLITLTCNLGHQRAIAVGLAHAAQTAADAVIVMDADGEDRPQDIRLLIEKHIANPGHIIAASRVRRSEGLLFRIFYVLYKKIFRLLTGQDISFGNFTLVPMNLLKRLTYVPSLWNHFSATILRSHLPLILVSTPRGRRYAGKSKLNFVSLVVHGLSAISVFSEAMLTRILLFFVLATTIGTLAVIIAVTLRLFNLATPGWATLVAASVAVISLQALLLTTMSAFLVLSTRSTIVLPPSQHANDFIDQVGTLFPGNSLGQPIAPTDCSSPPPPQAPGPAEGMPRTRADDVPG